MFALLLALGISTPTDTLDFVPEPERRRASVNDIFFHVFRPPVHEWTELGDPGSVPRWGNARYGRANVGAVDRNLPTMVYTHGFKSRGVKSGRAFAEALQWCYGRGGATREDQARCNVNLIIVDWSSLADIAQWTSTFPTLNYEQAKNNVQPVGEHVYGLLRTFVANHRLDWGRFHLVGHSLGAHVSGVVAREYTRTTPGRKIPHLTALDPAGPGFVMRNSDGAHPSYATDVQHVGRSDADYVDVWHSNGKEGPIYIPGYLGDLNPLGHADFYVSGGREQPNCSRTFGKCSHTRAKDIYAMSIEDPDSIVAWLCTNQGGDLEGCAVHLPSGGCLSTGRSCRLNWDEIDYVGDWTVPGASSARGGPWTYINQFETGGRADGEAYRNVCAAAPGRLPYNPSFAGFDTDYQNCRPIGNWVTEAVDPTDRPASDSDSEDPDDNDADGNDMRYAIN